MRHVLIMAITLTLLAGCTGAMVKPTKMVGLDNSGQVAIERQTTIPQTPVMVGNKMVTPKPIVSTTKYFRTQDIESFKMKLKQHTNGTVDMDVDEKGISATDPMAETTKIVQAIRDAISNNQE